MTSNKKYPRLSQSDIGRRLKKYSVSELCSLCAEIRTFLISSLSASGGHLASNLGAVELSVALEYCFDTSRDRLVFDVGHQCYTHKLLTGRFSDFSLLRKKGGPSGFPKPAESKTDAFVAGHGSTSVSVAAGLARAHKLRGGDPSRRFIAFVGDGAISGGMVIEALNDAGAARLPLIVVLNDNGMAIGNTVGSFSSVLTKMRVNPDYRSAKKTYHALMKAIPGGEALNEAFTRVKNSIKYTLIPSSFFECLGFKYIGPVDGHDVGELIRLFSEIKSYDRPVVIHAVTKKGCGWAASERDPERFHAVEGYSVETGKCISSGEKSLSSVFGEALCELAKKHRDVTAITAAMPRGTGLDEFAKRFPKRYIDVGIAEEHAVTMSAGLAAGGMRPFCAIYSTFLQRSFDQIIHDVGIMQLPVVFCIDRAGFVPGDGETHQGLYDVGMLSLVPGMKVYMPSNATELQTLLSRVHADPSGPAAIRYPRGSGAKFAQNTADSDTAVLREGGHITLVTAGRLVDNVLSAAELLSEKGISTAVIKLNRILPVPVSEIEEFSSGDILVCEELASSGSVSEHLAALLPQRRVFGLNAGSRFFPADSVDGMMQSCGLDADGIAAKAEEIFRGN